MTGSPDRCRHCLVRTLTLCDDLPAEELRALDRIAVHKTIEDGTVLFRAGENSAYCAHILGGMMKVQLATAGGHHQTVAILKAGDFLGQPFERASRVNAVALGTVSLCLYSRVAFEQLAERYPALLKGLLTSMSHSLELARGRQVSLARKSTTARLAQFLVELSCEEDRVTIAMSRTDLADYLGMPLETLSRQFARLKNDGLVDFEAGGRSIALLDRRRLDELARG